MTVTGYIRNKNNGLPIPFASVTIVDEYGNYLNVGTAANQQGHFSLTSNLISDPNALVFSSQGYKPVAVDAVLFEGYPNVNIKLEEGDPNEPVVVTAHSKKNWLTWLLVGLGIYFVTKKK